MKRVCFFSFNGCVGNGLTPELRIAQCNYNELVGAADDNAGFNTEKLRVRCTTTKAKKALQMYGSNYLGHSVHASATPQTREEVDQHTRQRIKRSYV